MSVNKFAVQLRRIERINQERQQQNMNESQKRFS